MHAQTINSYCLISTELTFKHKNGVELQLTRQGYADLKKAFLFHAHNKTIFVIAINI